jgi:hypothetical protein
MLLVGVGLIVVGVLLPLLALGGIGQRSVSTSPDDLSSLWVAFWTLAIGIPLSAAGCVLAAVALVAHRYGRSTLGRSPSESLEREDFRE